MSARTDKWIRGRRDERGVALVEFALLLPLLALVVFGTIDMGRAYSVQNRLKNASREGAAYAQVKPTRVNCTSGGDDWSIERRVTSEDGSLSTLPGFSIAVTQGSTNTPVTGCQTASVPSGAKVKVTVRADFDVITPFVGAFTGDPVHMNATTEVIAQ